MAEYIVKNVITDFEEQYMDKNSKVIGVAVEDVVFLENKRNALISFYHQMPEKFTVKDKTSSIIELEDKDGFIWMLIPVGESGRGFTCSKIVVIGEVEPNG